MEPNNIIDVSTSIDIDKEELLQFPDVQGLATKVIKEGDRIRLQFNTRDALILKLWNYTILEELSYEVKNGIKKTIGILQDSINVVQLEKIDEKGFKVLYSLKDGLGSDVEDLVKEAMGSTPVQVAIAQMLDIKPDKIDTKDPELGKAIETGTHLQPNGATKTIALYLARGRTAPTLWEQGKEKKESLTRGSAQTLLHAIKAYQKLPKGQDKLVIDNLEETAKEWGLSSSQELKNVLEMLGGYVHPFIEKVPGGGLKVSYKQLLDVEVNYGKRVEEKYETIDPNIRGKLGWLENEKVESIEIKPHQKLLDQMGGKDLGSRVVQDKLLIELPELSDLALKILMYAISNKQKTEKISRERLLPKIFMDVAKVTAREGKKGITDRIIKALQELQDKDHLEFYSYDPDREMFTLTKSDKTAPKRKGKT